jgi:predicted CoA-binding protein
MSEVDRAIDKILAMRTVAVVGLSRDASKPSHDVANYLKLHGYRIIPVNPTVTEVLGEKAYPSLLKLPDELKAQVEVVDIFRRAEDVPLVVVEAIELHESFSNPKAIWMQLGIVNEASAQLAREAGLIVVMDRCMKIEYARREQLR